MRGRTTAKHAKEDYTMCDLRLPLKSQIQRMLPGMKLAFPLEKLSSIRALASVVGMETGLHFMTQSKREERLVVVSCLK